MKVQCCSGNKWKYNATFNKKKYKYVAIYCINVSLYCGFCWQVTDLKAEYFPPKVEVILQNEIPTDFYIVVSGAMVYKIFNKSNSNVIYSSEILNF